MSIINNYEFDKDTASCIYEMESDINEKYMWYASFYKQDGFKAEKEIRLSILATKNGSRSGEVKYYSMKEKGVLRPYLDVTFGYRRTGALNQKFYPCLPLKSIMIGPSANQQMAFYSIVHRIKYGKVRVYEYVKNEHLLFKAFVAFFEEVVEWLNLKYMNLQKS